MERAQRGSCPGGVPSLSIECDPRRPWPRCPPQTYCYATNVVDIGPYFCCPSSKSANIDVLAPVTLMGNVETFEW
ncbi:unnamed protein product [Heligmosomoides polygyrus]|uniref:Single domain-containing protein n=1 Tax=Heligmosomoides polygyrus TaxID=6339 RepID=A0A183FA90_HELPZ|nr:unnamed protein product [Heligmosomoides polygyrus]